MIALARLLGVLILVGEAIVLVPLYLWMRPASGSWLNMAVGTIGLASMIAMLVYSVARRSAWLRRIARLSVWLELHIFLGLQGVLLVVVHSLPMLWRSGARPLLNPGLIDLVAVLVVFFSGLFGRYLFALVPRTPDGRHLTVAHAEKELSDLLRTLPEPVRARIGAPPRTLLGVAGRTILRPVVRWRLRREVGADVAGEALRALDLHGIAVAMNRTRRVFHLWIVVHRFIAAGVYFVSFVHAILGIMFSPRFGWLAP